MRKLKGKNERPNMNSAKISAHIHTHTYIDRCKCVVRSRECRGCAFDVLIAVRRIDQIINVSTLAGVALKQEDPPYDQKW